MQELLVQKLELKRTRFFFSDFIREPVSASWDFPLGHGWLEFESMEGGRGAEYGDLCGPFLLPSDPD